MNQSSESICLFQTDKLFLKLKIKIIASGLRVSKFRIFFIYGWTIIIFLIPRWEI